MSPTRAAHLLGARAHAEQIILAHVPMTDTSHEIPAAQQLITELGPSGGLLTLEAEHCQKNL
jgi:hypothetical protein